MDLIFLKPLFCVSDFTKATGIMAASKGIVTKEGHRPALV